MPRWVLLAAHLQGCSSAGPHWKTSKPCFGLIFFWIYCDKLVQLIPKYLSNFWVTLEKIFPDIYGFLAYESHLVFPDQNVSVAAARRGKSARMPEWNVLTADERMMTFGLDINMPSGRCVTQTIRNKIIQCELYCHYWTALSDNMSHTHTDTDCLAR